MPDPSARTALVVGAGLSGLAAARRLTSAGWTTTIAEAGSAPGGCLRESTLGGLLPTGLDVGAEASLARRPETRALIAELGLEPVHPSREHGSQIFARGEMRPIPAGTLMGVPADPEVLRGLISDDGVARAAAEVLTAPVDGDVSVGDFIAARLGDEVVDTVLDPLIGGVYAGRCRELSLAATVPALVPAARSGSSVLDAVAAVLASRAATKGASIPGAGQQTADRDRASAQTGERTAAQEPASAPVFLSLDGGIHGLVDALAADLTAHGAELRTRTPVRALERTADGWRARTDAGPIDAERIVLAVPAHAAAPMIADAAPELAAALGAVEYADSAVVTMLLDTSEQELTGSGFLVPPAEGTFVKASTFASNKWPWLAARLPAGTAAVRMSVGRAGDDAWQSLSDEEIAVRALADWRAMTGHSGKALVLETTRWTGALPQYRPGHAARAAELLRLAEGLPGFDIVGNYLDGVGLPACLARADALTADL